MSDPSVVVLGVLTLAATVLTAAFTGWAVWQRWRYTARPFWTEARFLHVDPARNGRAQAVFEIENRGDAPALDVHIFVGPPNDLVEHTQRSTAALPTGQSVRISVDVAARGNPQYDPYGDVTSDPTRIEWTHHSARIEWRQHPVLRRVRRRTFELTPPPDVLMTPPPSP